MAAQRQEGAAGPQALQQEAALAVSKLLPPQSARILRGKAKPAKATQGAKKRTADAVADAAQGAKKRTATAVTRKEMSATSLLTSLPPADAGQLPPTGAHPSTLLHALQALQSYQHTSESEDEAIAVSDEEDTRNTAPGAILEKMSELFTKIRWETHSFRCRRGLRRTSRESRWRVNAAGIRQPQAFASGQAETKANTTA